MTRCMSIGGKAGVQFFWTQIAYTKDTKETKNSVMHPRCSFNL